MNKRPAELDDIERKKQWIAGFDPGAPMTITISGKLLPIQPDQCAHMLLDERNRCFMCSLQFPPDD